MRTVAVASAAVLVLTGCGGGRTASAPPAVTPVASPAYDRSTVLACKEARVAMDGPANAASDKHASAARSFAALSDVPALRDVAAKNTRPDESGQPIDDVRAMTAAMSVGTWCITHKVPGR